MAILNYREKVDRAEVHAAFYPFNAPGKISGMLIGNDLDALLSAALLKTRFGWDIVGIYDYQTLWYATDDSNFTRNLLSGKYLAVDLDIYHPEIPSIGHHILEIEPKENLPGQRLSLNPNLIRGINLSNFGHKYPLGTIHFLLWIFGIEISDPVAQMLIWLADSAYINAQSHRFRSNVSDWLQNYMESKTLSDVFQVLDSLEYEQTLQAGLISRLTQIPICQPFGQIRSRHLQMSGYQCQWSHPQKFQSEIRSVIELITRITGWQSIRIPTYFNHFQGVRLPNTYFSN